MRVTPAFAADGSGRFRGDEKRSIVLKPGWNLLETNHRSRKPRLRFPYRFPDITGYKQFHVHPTNYVPRGGTAIVGPIFGPITATSAKFVLECSKSVSVTLAAVPVPRPNAIPDPTTGPSRTSGIYSASTVKIRVRFDENVPKMVTFVGLSPGTRYNLLVPDMYFPNMVNASFKTRRVGDGLEQQGSGFHYAVIGAKHGNTADAKVCWEHVNSSLEDIDGVICTGNFLSVGLAAAGMDLRLADVYEEAREVSEKITGITERITQTCNVIRKVYRAVLNVPVVRTTLANSMWVPLLNSEELGLWNIEQDTFVSGCCFRVFREYFNVLWEDNDGNESINGTDLPLAANRVLHLSDEVTLLSIDMHTKENVANNP